MEFRERQFGVDTRHPIKAREPSQTRLSCLRNAYLISMINLAYAVSRAHSE